MHSWSTIPCLKQNLMHCSFIRKCTIHSAWKAKQMIVATKLSKLSQVIAIPWHLVAKSCTTCHSQAYGWVTELSYTPLYMVKISVRYNLPWLSQFMV
jgi:hypothetical protein